MGRKPLKKVRKKDDRVTEKWLKKILPVFQREGFGHFTMDEIVNLAGVSKATFYKYFSSKEKLIDEIIRLKLSEIGGFQSALFDASHPYYDRYFNAIQISARGLSQVSHLFLNDLKSNYPKKWMEIDAFKKFALQILQQFYEEGIQSGHLLHVDPKIMVLTDQVFFEHMTDPQFLKVHEVTLHDAFLGYFTMKCEGIILKKRALSKLKERFIQFSEKLDKENL